MVRPLLLPARAAEPNGGFVRYHPDGGLQVGDRVSVEVFLPDGSAAAGAKLRAVVILPERLELGLVDFSRDALGRQVFTLLWAWDTRELSAGDYQIQYSIEPGGDAWTETVRLNKPPAEAPAAWLERDTLCCRLHFLSGTDAARDVDALAQQVDERAQAAAQRLGYDLLPQKKVDVNFVPRVLGQGGFAANEVTVSYADDNYAGTDVGMLIQHELTHRMDAELGGELRPTMWAEGIAVYLTGGHYKPEPVLLRAAALVGAGEYIPLAVLVEDFYAHQHEIGYLEAAALVGYMSNRWGWDAFNRFYRDIRPGAGQAARAAIDAALERHFQLDLRGLDDQFYNWLSGLPLLPDMRVDLSLTVDYFEAIRAYQRAEDPAADFRQVWLPDPKEMRNQGITADYLRGPRTERNLKIARLLSQAGRELGAGRFIEAENAIWLARQATRHSP